MPDRVRLGSASQGIELFNPSFESEEFLEDPNYWMDFDASVKAAASSYETHLTMISPYRADMLGFFQELADGAADADWHSEYDEMRVKALLEHDAYRLDVTILGPPSYSRNDRLHLVVTRPACQRFLPELASFLREAEPERLRKLEPPDKHA